eukprot:2874690-Pyramimonas_sp.AAC.1
MCIRDRSYYKRLFKPPEALVMEGDVGVVGVNASDPRSKPTKKNAHTGRGGGRGSGGKGVKQDEAHGPGEVALP